MHENSAGRIIKMPPPKVSPVDPLSPEDTQTSIVNKKLLNHETMDFNLKLSLSKSDIFNNPPKMHGMTPHARADTENTQVRSYVTFLTPGNKEIKYPTSVTRIIVVNI